MDRQDYTNEAEEWADLIADNRIAELSQIDDALLASLLSEVNIGDIDLDLTGFTDKQIDNLFADFNIQAVREDNFYAAAAVAEIKEPRTNYIYIHKYDVAIAYYRKILVFIQLK